MDGARKGCVARLALVAGFLAIANLMVHVEAIPQPVPSQDAILHESFDHNLLVANRQKILAKAHFGPDLALRLESASSLPRVQAYSVHGNKTTLAFAADIPDLAYLALQTVHPSIVKVDGRRRALTVDHTRLHASQQELRALVASRRSAYRGGGQQRPGLGGFSDKNKDFLKCIGGAGVDIATSCLSVAVPGIGWLACITGSLTGMITAAICAAKFG